MSDSNQSVLVERLNFRPVLCWVVDAHDGKPCARLVTEFSNARFYTDSGECFNFARALSLDDLAHYFVGEGI